MSNAKSMSVRSENRNSLRRRAASAGRGRGWGGESLIKALVGGEVRGLDPFPQGTAMENGCFGVDFAKSGAEKACDSAEKRSICEKLE
jgi:hypothetical protein